MQFEAVNLWVTIANAVAVLFYVDQTMNVYLPDKTPPVDSTCSQNTKKSGQVLRCILDLIIVLRTIYYGGVRFRKGYTLTSFEETNESR